MPPPQSSAAFVPPTFLPLALHLVGAGTIVMAVSLFGVVALLAGGPLAWSTWTGSAMLTGQALVLLGLFLGGRTSPGSNRHWFARVAMALWGSALALDVSRGDVRAWLSEHLPSAERLPQLTGWVAWCGSFVLLSWMLLPTFREVKRRSWLLVVGTALVGAQAAILGWTLFVRPNVSAMTSSLGMRLARVAPGALGIFLVGTAVFILARTLQPLLVFEEGGAKEKVASNSSNKPSKPARSKAKRRR